MNIAKLTLTNPETGNKILISTALSYPAEHKAHVLALKYIRTKEKEREGGETQTTGKAPSVKIDASVVLGKKTAGPSGTNAGGFYTGTDGVDRYVKAYNDPSQAYCEKLSGTIYRALGIGAPKTHTFQSDGKTMFASDIIKDGEVHKNKIHKFTPEMANKVLDGFLADVLLSNWDSVGSELDNVLFTDGDVHRIDNGGSLLFRAQAGKKNPAVLDKLTELDGLFNPSLNRAYMSVAAKAGIHSAEDLRPRFKDQMKKIDALRQAHGSWEEVVEKVAPKMNEVDKERVSSMLETRHKLLADYVNQQAA